MNQKEIDNLAKIIWDYHHMNHKLTKADCIFVLGSNDIRVAERGAQLYLDGYAPLLIFSGGLGNLTRRWKESEADKFSKVALKIGVPQKDILIENKSTNTGENVLFTRKLLNKKGIHPSKVIVVQKPYMERRAFATFKKIWPGIKLTVTSPQISFDEYPNKDIRKNKLINIIVGDLQRIKLYPGKGFQISQKIPKEVWRTYEKLVKAGYDKWLVE